MTDDQFFKITECIKRCAVIIVTIQFLFFALTLTAIGIHSCS